MSNKLLYLIGGIAVGIGAYYLYNRYKNDKVRINMQLKTHNKVPQDANVSFVLMNTDKTINIIPARYMTVIETETGDKEYTTIINTNKIRKGGYIAIFDFYTANDEYIGSIEQELVFPNDIGLELPEHIVTDDKTIKINLRG